jgi:hypothetical protein
VRVDPRVRREALGRGRDFLWVRAQNAQDVLLQRSARCDRYLQGGAEDVQHEPAAQRGAKHRARLDELLHAEHPLREVVRRLQTRIVDRDHLRDMSSARRLISPQIARSSTSRTAVTFSLESVRIRRGVREHYWWRFDRGSTFFAVQRSRSTAGCSARRRRRLRDVRRATRRARDHRRRFDRRFFRVRRVGGGRLRSCSRSLPRVASRSAPGAGARARAPSTRAPTT